MTADVDVTSLAGGSGWVGAGLLGLVLFWLLMKYLPDKDKQLKSYIDGHNANTVAIVAQHTASLAGSRVDFKDSLRIVTEHCEREIATTSALFVKDLKALTDSVQSLAAIKRDT